MNKRAKFTLAVLLALFIAGCIASGTITFKFPLDDFVSSSSGLEVQEIDLTTNSDYNDHKDEIRSVDQIEVVGWFHNLLQTENQAEIFISDDGTFDDPDTVRTYATRVFVSPSIPGNDSVFISWAEARDHLENVPALRDAVDEGYFWIYGIAENSPYLVRYDLTLIITITVGG